MQARGRYRGRLVAAVVVCLGAAGGCEPADEVVLYASADEHLARQVAAMFAEETGIEVRLVGDTEAKKTTGLVARLRSERDHPQADVFWSSEIFLTIALADEGIFAAHTSPLVETWPAAYRDAGGRWFGFAARARVIAYAPDRVAEADRPVSWTDLTRSYLDGRVVMADPRFGTTGGHLGAMKTHWDRTAMPGYYAAFLMGLRDNAVRMLPSGNAGVVQAIIDGDADVGLTDTDDVLAARRRGHRIDYVLAAHSHEAEPGNGTLLIPNTVARVAGGPNPDAAGRLVDFLLSERVERWLAESESANTPLGPGRTGGHAIPDPLAVDYRRAAANRLAAVAMAMKIIGGTADPATRPARDTDGNDPFEREE
ncbi:MAG: extracellular solute-binding protein [Phycisphaerales bacterium]|nr:extracellular solute-binding protein [Phycisphaerae bacterium]NNF44500.1 extracellular solute-binding protein [Phycisphaerales bacterium]NNM26126.1 extracellular solute-binding protein [Phycisphaerales bacterium]